MDSAQVVRHGPEDVPLAERVWQLDAGVRLEVLPGTYRGPIALPRDIEIQAAGGMGSVTIESTAGGTLSVEGAEQVALNDLVLRGPDRSMGAVLRVYNEARIQARGCIFTGGRGQGEGGGAIDVQQGHIRLDGCRFTHNVAMQGGALRASGAVYVEVRNCVFADNGAAGVGGGAVFANQGAEIHLVGCTFVGNKAPIGRAVLAGGDALGAATIEARNCLFAAGEPELRATASEPGHLALHHCVLPALPDDLHAAITVGEGVLERRVDVASSGPGAWSATFDGLLVGLGDPTAFEADEADLHGRVRSRILVGAVG